MAGYIGRALLVKRNGSTIASVVSKSLTFNAEAVNVSTDDDGKWRKLLEDSGETGVDASVEGVYVAGTDALIADMIDGTSIRAGELTLPSGATLTGDFRLNNVEISGERAGRVEFSAGLQSSGTITYTAA